MLSFNETGLQPTYRRHVEDRQNFIKILFPWWLGGIKENSSALVCVVIKHIRGRLKRTKMKIVSHSINEMKVYFENL